MMKLNQPRLSKLRRSLCAWLVLLTASGVSASLLVAAPVPQTPQSISGRFQTAVSEAQIDDRVSAEWVDGAERTLAKPTAVRQIIWTRSAAPTGGPVAYGVSPKPGVRHLRVGFATAINVGSVLVRGGGELSVLKSTAQYPGDLSNDALWIPAHRLQDRKASVNAVDEAHYALWELSPGTTTRALRFTHTSVATDSAFGGVLGGVYVLAERYANVAPQATVYTSANRMAVTLLTDEQYNGWKTWDNGPDYRHQVTATQPEWIVLAWARPVALSGLAALWAGFNAGDTELFTGAGDPQNAPETSWKPIGQPQMLRNQYPRPLGVDFFDFGKTITTTAVRLHMTSVTDESHHQHLAGKTRDGARVWLGELMAISPLQASDLQSAILPVPADSSPKPPIPVRFTLPSAGFVTLVIEDAKGNRVRNLVSNTWFEQGSNTIFWDGTDDLSRNPDAANHGQYLIPMHFVAPGTYNVRGLYHAAIDLRYEFSIYNPGNPPWETADTKGGWLTNHTPPSSALFVPHQESPTGQPLIYLGSYISEGGAGLAWVDENGVKQGGRGWIGGNWTAAPYLARDTGPNADLGTFAYVGAPTGDNNATAGKPVKAVIRLTGMTKSGDHSILNYTFDPHDAIEHEPGGRLDWAHQMGGLAVYGGLIAVSLPLQNQLLFVDARTGKSLGTAPVEDAHGLAFDNQGRLFVISGKRLLRYSIGRNPVGFNPQHMSSPETLIATGLDQPTGLAIDAKGTIFISDGGNANQVRIYDASGQFQRTIGHPGPSQAGPYDPLHMNHPAGLTVDDANHLWVTEADFQPKRVSVWSMDGQLLKAFYGPSEYGGGGSLDPQDKSKFYYHAMEFKLDWKTGTNSITNILYRPGKDAIPLPAMGSPSTVLYSAGHRYFINSYLGHATNGPTIGMLFLDKGNILAPVAAIGKANDWPLLREDLFRSKLPAGADLTNNSANKSVMFTWSDTNENGLVDPEEVSFINSTTGPVMISSDENAKALGPVMLNAFVDGKAMRYSPTKISASGVPFYDLAKGDIVAEGAQRSASDGGGELLVSTQDVVLTTAPLPYAKQGLGGIDKRGHTWSYPSLWPGLHPSHSAPIPDQPGELIGTTHLLGPMVNPRGTDTEPLWAINGNTGNIYLFTADGLFVSELFHDGRTGKQWNMPIAQRNMQINDLTLHEENFFPSLTQTADGNIYLVDGAKTSIVRIDGLSSLRALPSFNIQVENKDIDQAQSYLKVREVARQSTAGIQSLKVSIHAGDAPALGSLPKLFKASDWIPIDRRITQQGWNQKPDVVEAAVTVAGGRLFAAFRTNEPALLTNSGAEPNAPFKTGGALDLMLGTNPGANPKRESPVAGDLRLLVYQVSGKTKATLYRAVVPGTSEPVRFASPARTITLDQVQDVSDVVQLSSTGGNYQFSIPLSALNFKPSPGQQIKADLGILRGEGGATVQRAYWSNKATGITSDVPSEAELTPGLWGTWTFQSVP